MHAVIKQSHATNFFGERFGALLGIMTVAAIPEFLIALGKTVAEADETFATWYPNHEAEFKALAEAYL